MAEKRERFAPRWAPLKPNPSFRESARGWLPQARRDYRHHRGVMDFATWLSKR